MAVPVDLAMACKSSAYQILAGFSGAAAIGTDAFHHVSVMGKNPLRMRSWRSYIKMEGH
jgi:hypothetical protein